MYSTGQNRTEQCPFGPAHVRYAFKHTLFPRVPRRPPAGLHPPMCVDGSGRLDPRAAEKKTDRTDSSRGRSGAGLRGRVGRDGKRLEAARLARGLRKNVRGQRARCCAFRPRSARYPTRRSSLGASSTNARVKLENTAYGVLSRIIYIARGHDSGAVRRVACLRDNTQWVQYTHT